MARNVEFDWHLADWMGALKVSQADLSRETGFSKAKMSELVNGVSRYNRDVVNTLANALRILPHELLMHPDDAFALRRLRESAIRIASETPPPPEPTEARSEKPKKVS
jgi:transcriptional regulator with XRE-family HTH domain